MGHNRYLGKSLIRWFPEWFGDKCALEEDLAGSMAAEEWVILSILNPFPYLKVRQHRPDKLGAQFKILSFNYIFVQ